jgi:plastocyanin
MKKLISLHPRLIVTALVLFSLISLTNSCTKTTSLPGTNEVFIQGMAFTPSSITVTAGSTIIWTNKDGVPHTVTCNTVSIFDSGSISPGGTWSHTFNNVGTFQYKCTIHPTMTGTVVVH